MPLENYYMQNKPQNTTDATASPLERTITLFQDVTKTTGNQRTIDHCLELIRDNQRLAKMVADLRPLYWKAEEQRRKALSRSRSITDDESRAAHEEAIAAHQAAKDRYDAAKKKLPAITLSGTFTKRAIEGLECYSGIVQADLDNIRLQGGDIHDLKKELAGDPHLLFVFTSPSGEGLKCGVLVETGAEAHAAAFAAMRRYFAATYGIEPDSACSDVSRLCFLSSDPLLHINEGATPLDWRAWPEPDEADDDAPIELPLDALPQVIRELAVSCSEVFQVDQALPAVAALTILSAALGKSVVCAGATNGRVTPSNLFNLIVAPPSYGKGVAGVVAKPLLDASKELADKWEEEIRPDLRAGIAMAEVRKKEILAEIKGGSLTAAGRAEVRAELAALEREIETNTREAATPPMLYVGSATGAALGVALRRNGEALLSFALEAGDAIRVAAGRFSADQKCDYDLMLSGYTGEPFTEARISRESPRLDAPCLSVLWACQPSLVRELYGTAEAQERGLLARINVVCCDDDETPLDDGIFREVPAELEAHWENLIHAALDLRRAGRKVTFHATAEAKEVFRQWHNAAVTLRNGAGRESESKLKRCRENAIRIALCIAAAEWLETGGHGDDPALDAATAARGVALADFFLSATLRLTRGAVHKRQATRLDELLRCVDQFGSGGRITLRRLRNNHGFGEVEVRQIAERETGLLRIEEKPTTTRGGRPSPELVKIPQTATVKTVKTVKTSDAGKVSEVLTVSEAASNGNSAK